MLLVSIMRKNIPRDETEKKQPGHKINIIFRIYDMEYFGSEIVDEAEVKVPVWPSRYPK